MCRAVWVLIASDDDDAFRALRRACGIEVQVVGRIRSAEDLSTQTATNADCVVIDASMGEQIVGALRESMPGAALVWVGEDAPEGVQEARESADVERSITAALNARRA